MILLESWWFPFNTISISGKRKMPQGAPSGQQGASGMTVICLLPKIHTQTKHCEHFGHEFGSNLMHVQTVFKNTLKWPEYNSQNVGNWTPKYSSVFENCLPSTHTFICSACWLTSSTEDTLLLNLENHTKTCILPLFALHTLLSTLSKVSVAFFPSL